MAETLASTSAEDNAEVILLQLLAAVGQGAGTLRVGYDAALHLRDTYLERIAAHAGDWQSARLLAFEWARAAGRQAAWLAGRDGAFEISADHLREGLTMLARRSSKDGDCPFC